MKTYIANMNYLLEQLNNTFEMAEERNSKLKYKTIEIIKFEEQKKRETNRISQIYGDTNINITGFQEGEEKNKEAERIKK